jgi:hypothetical protein
VGNINPILLGIVFVVVAWITMFTLTSQIGGWATLARQYKALETFTGSRWNFEKAQMRWLIGYNNCLTIGADPRGLYISMFFPVRIGHPPLFIPWRDISFVSKKFLWVKGVELRLGRENVIPFRISDRLAQKLKSAAGASWPTESIA